MARYNKAGFGIGILSKLGGFYYPANASQAQINQSGWRVIRPIDEVVAGLKSGDIAGRDATGQTGCASQFELAALVMPATLEDIRATSANSERMPAKSTYFYPKLLSGLVINPLE